MAPTGHLFRRDVSPQVTTDLLVVFLVLILVSFLSVGALWILRRVRRSRKAALLATGSDINGKLALPKKKGHRRVSGISIASTISFEKRKSQSKFVDEEKQEFMANTTPPPAGGLPQIHVTFPEETDTAGKRQSGRVVVLHVDDKGCIGMEPVSEDDKPPAYHHHHHHHDRFESLDLDRIGGLKEKEFSQTQQATRS